MQCSFKNLLAYFFAAVSYTCKMFMTLATAVAKTCQISLTQKLPNFGKKWLACVEQYGLPDILNFSPKSEHLPSFSHSVQDRQTLSDSTKPGPSFKLQKILHVCCTITIKPNNFQVLSHQIFCSPSTVTFQLHVTVEGLT